MKHFYIHIFCQCDQLLIYDLHVSGSYFFIICIYSPLIAKLGLFTVGFQSLWLLVIFCLLIEMCLIYSI